MALAERTLIQSASNHIVL